MRGRVGRSNTESYCYLIAPNSKILTDISNKRINSMMKYSDLGSGLKIALRDLDIRGAGNLLGADQSGFVNEIGFEMYQRILNDAINELKKERLNEENLINYKECQFESDIEMYIPKKYIFNDHERLKTYRMLNSLNDEIEAARIKANEILRNCKEEIKKNTQEALADIDIKIEELVEISEKNIITLKSEAKKEVNALSKKLAPEIVKALIP